ncbi:VOC family protein [Corynebacterium lipophiloflavum]|uniref:Glyoxalase family protein n=1 Tax=Corynebacterium lipophiloflavum (strain ATCC 700352 / DSM 44291 / CCUG 37336 / JCM 10383 / DMMZ 1944) TaxID=525263 RepID=C0XTV3_CORLD|nr:VOC family protein [Corynebacterium lipophiloflavum]EEI16287.1 glyoxalase family protein [Corynebacterium lipophiloflavum DSM 44291]
MPAFQALEGMPYWQDLLTSDLRKSSYFYSKLLDWEVSHDSYAVARMQGLPIAGFVPQDENGWVVYILTRDVDGITRAVQQRGGTVLATAEVSLGRMALCADPAGAVFGVIHPAGEDQFVAAGEPGTPVWYEYIGAEESLIDFYADLFDWQVNRSEGYYTATVEGAAVLGMRVDDIEQGFWGVYLGVDNVARASRGVAELGGEVLIAPHMSPFGPLTVIADSTGATVTLCEIDPPVADDEVGEADSVLDL